jgi:hypothetical protein
LLFGSAKEDGLAFAETTLHGKENLKYLNWRNVCGKDEVLTNTIKTMIMMGKKKAWPASKSFKDAEVGK